MPNITELSFNREILPKYGFSYQFILDEKLNDFHMEQLREAMQNYLNTLSPIGELLSLPHETVKEIISKYE